MGVVDLFVDVLGLGLDDASLAAAQVGYTAGPHLLVSFERRQQRRIGLVFRDGRREHALERRRLELQQQCEVDSGRQVAAVDGPPGRPAEFVSRQVHGLCKRLNSRPSRSCNRGMKPHCERRCASRGRLASKRNSY